MEKRTAGDIVDRVGVLKRRNTARDKRHSDVLAIRRGDYESVAPGIFPDEFDKAMVANIVDTAARDTSEVMAPMPSVACVATSMTNETQKKFALRRQQIAKSYIERSRLTDQRFAGADRYVSFGFFAYIVEPSFEDRAPIVRVADTASVYYLLDGRGRTKQYAEVKRMPADEVCAMYPDIDVKGALYNKGFPAAVENMDVTIIDWWDDNYRQLVLEDCGLELSCVPIKTSRCPIRIVERPSITTSTHGQFDDVLWVQIARALVQFYTMSALEQSVNAPLVLPSDVQDVELGPLSVLTTDNPQGVGRVPLNIPQGVFPESQILQQEQLTGSRYPQGRSGNMDASVITGQGVQALMGTFDTQVQTFQRLDASALEDVMEFLFETDEAYWPNLEKSYRIKDNGAPFEVKYTPVKDINHDFTCTVSYGAIAGLDPNRGLVFVLQILAAGLVSKATARKNLPVDLNALEEERQIDIEALEGSLTASIAALGQAIPMMASQGQDPTSVVEKMAKVMDLRRKGSSMEDAVVKVFVPPEPKPGEGPDPSQQDPLAALMGAAGGGGAPGGAPQGGPGSPGQSLLMSLAGMSRSGDAANLQANVSRSKPI